MAKSPKETSSPLGKKLTNLERPEGITNMIYALGALCLLLLIGDLFHIRHSKFEFADLFGFFGFYGFLAFAFIIFATKVLKNIIGRRQDYYAPNVVDAEKYPAEELDIKDDGDE